MGFSLFQSHSCSSNSSPEGLWGHDDLYLSLHLLYTSASKEKLRATMWALKCTHYMWAPQSCHVAGSETVRKREEERELVFTQLVKVLPCCVANSPGHSGQCPCHPRDRCPCSSSSDTPEESLLLPNKSTKLQLHALCSQALLPSQLPSKVVYATSSWWASTPEGQPS